MCNQVAQLVEVVLSNLRENVRATINCASFIVQRVPADVESSLVDCRPTVVTPVLIPCTVCVDTEVLARR